MSVGSKQKHTRVLTVLHLPILAFSAAAVSRWPGVS